MTGIEKATDPKEEPSNSAVLCHELEAEAETDVIPYIYASITQKTAVKP